MTEPEPSSLVIRRAAVASAIAAIELPSSARLLVEAGDVFAVAAALLLGRRDGVPVLLLPAGDDTRREDRVAAFGPTLTVCSESAGANIRIAPMDAGVETQRQSGLTFYTSGTTGIPKPVMQGWDQLFSSTRHIPGRLQGRRWFSGYGAGSFAGLQVLCAAMETGEALVVPDHPHPGIPEQIAALVEGRAEIVSGTPTWWRMVISAWPAGVGKPALAQATLGGEVVDQAILDAIRRHFAPAGLTHVYASSEAGSVVAISDGRAGFPVESLSEDREPGLRVVDGVLQVRSRRAALGHAPGAWLDTGDLIEIREGRCYFAGRADARLNIGGQKVSPEEVEQALLAHEDVLACAVYGKFSPVVGTLLAADVVVREPGNFKSGEVRRWLSARLPAWKVPSVVRRVPGLELSATGKRVRQRMAS